MKLQHDANGNKVLKVEQADLQAKYSTKPIRGFSVQTLGDLPETHKHGIHYATKGELFQYINGHGTDNQKQLLSCGHVVTISEIRQGYYMGSYKPVFKELTNQDLDELTELLGGRKKQHIRNALEYNIDAIPSWAADRLEYLPSQKRWAYTAGQDYPHELTLIRKALLK